MTNIKIIEKPTLRRMTYEDAVLMLKHKIAEPHPMLPININREFELKELCHNIEQGLSGIGFICDNETIKYYCSQEEFDEDWNWRMQAYRQYSENETKEMIEGGIVQGVKYDINKARFNRIWGN